ncbi:MAG: tRNA (adenosine(37)-N6)-dimethylallyltransferase MiaA [Bacteroidetes bacterium]|nr:tRNA (adenosine(37)-N6)-dimethylallyltransferase MiaA [Bacteroidota bacterium]MBS1632777.1 tRNA (adenosine(37)-N6)-dimethylallyltransferase MiaA [Bacteroidota bacterium]
MSFPKKIVLVIVGPTAAGKTSAAIGLAKHFNTEIISADSRQCFRELNIGVARPSEEELKTVKHYFIASHSIKDEMNAALFEQYALEKAEKIFKTNSIAIMVGGTGLYIKAFCEGLHDIPAVDPQLREKINLQYEMKGLEWVQQEISRKDPEFYKKGEIKNPQRLLRALEVVESTGQSILSFRNTETVKRDFKIVRIGLELPKEELHRNINLRVDAMMNNGLIDEVKRLYHCKNLNALQTVGYSELFEFLDKKISLADAVEKMKRNTRQYAKRQMTWFKKDKRINWFFPIQFPEILNFAEKANLDIE